MSEEWRKDPRFKMSSSEKEEYRKNKDREEENENMLIGLGIFAVLVFFIFKGINSASDYLGDRSSKKARCQTHYSVSEAKTDFAAKQAYKKCMNK